MISAGNRSIARESFKASDTIVLRRVGDEVSIALVFELQSGQHRKVGRPRRQPYLGPEGPAGTTPHPSELVAMSTAQKDGGS